MKTKFFILLAALGLLRALPLTAAPLGSVFTYQGKLALHKIIGYPDG